MIEYLNRDLTSFHYGLIAHGVNCMGKMGRGVASAIKKQWPEVYSRYISITPNKKLLGTVQFVEIRPSTLTIANCFTQVFYGIGGRFADLKAIDSCLQELFKYSYYGHVPLYIPKIGCGLGGLKWDEVLPILEKNIQLVPSIRIFVCDNNKKR
jgi:O-acetyl-ADP-ribose deacetylase (regulator of RNase III)